MAIDFARSRLLAYAEEDTACEYTGETRAVRQARYEECARALFEVPRGRFHHSLEWQDFFRLQCGECILWERTAIFSAVAQFGPKIEIRAVAVVNDHGVPCSPCGACRQVIYEFGPDALIFFQGANGPKQAHITELLPEGFRLQ
jgi:hypothetical protein